MKNSPVTPRDFEEKVVLVTGAGSGIGREAAQAFAARGALVYGADLNERGLAETQALVAHAGGTARVAYVDVAEEDDVAVLLARISAEAGRLDVAFNNAGITGGTHRIEDCPASDFEKLLRVNLKSVFLGMKYELPLMQRGGGGAICNTASVVAITVPGGMCSYAASKRGVHDLTRVAAMENAAHNIRVNTLAHGWTKTPMMVTNSARNPAFAEYVKWAIAAKRSAQPSEVAAAAVWLCSADARYVFGQLFVVDGGMTIGGFELS